MSFLSSLKVSVSGMTAQRQRVNTISENIANAETTRTPEGGPYRRREIIFAAVSNDRSFDEELRAQDRSLSNATEVKVVGIVQDNRSPVLKYDPGHPDANEDAWRYQEGRLLSLLGVRKTVGFGEPPPSVEGNCGC